MPQQQYLIGVHSFDHLPEDISFPWIVFSENLVRALLSQMYLLVIFRHCPHPEHGLWIPFCCCCCSSSHTEATPSVLTAHPLCCNPSPVLMLAETVSNCFFKLILKAVSPASPLPPTPSLLPGPHTADCFQVTTALRALLHQ